MSDPREQNRLDFESHAQRMRQGTYPGMKVDEYDDDGDIDEAPAEAFRERAWGEVDPPAAPVPASGGFTINMQDPESRGLVILMATASGLAIEIKTGMKVGKGGPNSPMAAAKRMGFTGRQKLDALRWVVEQIEAVHPTYERKRIAELIGEREPRG